MVLFYEDKKKKPESKLRRRIKLLLWISFCLFALVWVSLSLIARVDAQNESLRVGVIDYMEQATGLDASIGAFGNIRFYPDLVVDLADISLTDPASGEVRISVGEVDFKMRFWDMFFSRTRWEKMSARDVVLAPGVLTASTLRIDRMGLREEGWDGQPALIIEGKYAGEPFTVRSVMDAEKKPYDRTFFSARDDGRFSVESSYLRLSAHSDRTDEGHPRLMIDELGLPERVGEGTLVFNRSWNSARIEARLKSDRSTYRADIGWKKKEIDGTLSFPVWNVADLAFIGGLTRLQDEFFIRRHRSGAEGFDKEMLVNLQVSIDKLMIGDKNMGTLSLPLKIEGGILKAGPFKGSIAGGSLSGTVILDGAQSPLNLTADLSLKDMKHEELQQALLGSDMASGNADIHVKLESSGERFSDLPGKLNGEALFIAGEGHLRSGMLNFWGKGLGQLIIPDFTGTDELDLACAIADFKIADGVAEPSPLFIDTDDVTIAGTGRINLVDGTIDMTLEPNAKDPTLLGLSTSVDIKGPLGDPAISPNTLSLGKTLGSVLLGTINPAFAVISMSDIGLSPSHPCYEYIGSPQKDGGAQPAAENP